MASILVAKVLYYCNHVQGDPTLYNSSNASDVCTFKYDFVLGRTVIDTWLLGAYPAPSSAQLDSYDYESVVRPWYERFYQNVNFIVNSQPHKLSTAELALVRKDQRMVGMLAFDTTEKVIKYFDGDVFRVAALYPPKRASINIATATTSTVEMKTDITRLIPATGFTSFGTVTDFTFNASTGQVTYTGSEPIAATAFVTVLFTGNILGGLLGVLIETEMKLFVSKNGNISTVPNARGVVDFISVGRAAVDSMTITCNFDLKTNDTLQLAGTITAGNNIRFVGINYLVQRI